MLYNELNTVIDERKRESKIHWKAKTNVGKVSKDDGGGELDLDPTKFNADVIFDEELKDLINKFFDDPDHVKDDEIKKTYFRGMCAKFEENA